MLDYMNQAHLGQIYALLTSGSPPLYIRLMALNALFLAIYAVRKASGAQPMGPGAALFVQVTALAANLLIMYQPQVENYLLNLSRRF